MSELVKALKSNTAKLKRRIVEQNVRILVIDIENSPNIAHVWGLWNNNVSLAQLQESQQIICFAAKWLGEKEVIFKSNFHDTHEEMIRCAWELLDEADIIVGYNSQSFDLKHLHTEFVDAGYPPPRPYKNVDLLHAVKKAFRFPSNKLDYVVQRLGLGSKVSHQGHTLWVQCMAGVAKAWTTMRKYNIMDVLVTEKLYYRILPWIEKHPHIGMFMDTEHDRCPRCGSAKLILEPNSTAKANVTTYNLYRCSDCGGSARSTVRGRAEDKLFTRKVSTSQ